MTKRLNKKNTYRCVIVIPNEYTPVFRAASKMHVNPSA